MNTPRNSAPQSGSSDSALPPGVVPVLLTESEAAAAFGVSRRTFQMLSAEPWMPAPRTLGPRLLRWSLDELRAAVADMPRQTQRTQPESLLRAKIERMKATGASA